MCGPITLAIGAVIALAFAWQGLVKQHVVLTRKNRLEGVSAAVFGVICLFLGIVLSGVSLLFMAAYILAEARRMGG